MKTLAIVIGINEYYEEAKLDNAVNDAHAISDVFSRLGYDVIYIENCDMEAMIKAMETYKQKISNYDASIIYFAGHGFQFEGENYLASTECQVAMPNKFHCNRTCLTLTEILEITKQSNNLVNIIIIDACRRSFDRGGVSSFTPIHAPKGTLIAFSTSPNEGAKDHGIDGHSIYTGSLLKYIGREMLSVELLFKKVRKTVYNLSDGSQTTWEHTSLINDFIFNTGQMVYSVIIPYDELVIKDKDFYYKDEIFNKLIEEMKSVNWDRQNAAIGKILKIKPISLDKNQQFIIGRNLLQCAGYAYASTNIFEDLKNNILKFSLNGENHVLNGILFEIYFDSNGDFRNENFKSSYREQVFALRKIDVFKSSFEFINKALSPYTNMMYYIPGSNEDIIDVDVLATSKKTTNDFGEEVEYQIIEKIMVSSKDITSDISRYGLYGENIMQLKEVVSHYLLAPKELIQLNPNIAIYKITFSSKI